MSMRKEDRTLVWIFAAILVVGIAVWVFRSSMEADVYNRITTGDVTTWEAMWINLRVDCN